MQGLLKLLFECPNIQVTLEDGPSNLLQIVRAKGGVPRSQRIAAIAEKIDETLPQSESTNASRLGLRVKSNVTLTKEQQHLKLLVEALVEISNFFAEQEEALANAKSNKEEARRILALIEETNEEQEVARIKAMSPEDRAKLAAQARATLSQ